jgi:Flp pilus assembly protein TadD
VRSAAARAAPPRGRRRAAALLTLALILAGGAALDGRAPPGRPANEIPSTSSSPAMPHAAEVKRRFDEAVVMLHARQHEHALVALHRVLTLAPTMPEAHTNMGYALLGLGRAKQARDFFDSAIALQPRQANAYYGLALAWEAAGDLAMATGAMRSYLHLAGDERPQHLRRARAALWEWEQARAAPAAAAAATPKAAAAPPAGR